MLTKEQVQSTFSVARQTERDMAVEFGDQPDAEHLDRLNQCEALALRGLEGHGTPIRGMLYGCGLVTFVDGTQVQGVVIEVTIPPTDWPLDAVFNKWPVNVYAAPLPAPPEGK